MPYEHQYDPVSVQRAIDESKHRGRPIGQRETRLIHAVLRGRTPKPASPPQPRGPIPDAVPETDPM